MQVLALKVSHALFNGCIVNLWAVLAASLVQMRFEHGSPSILTRDATAHLHIYILGLAFRELLFIFCLVLQFF